MAGFFYDGERKQRPGVYLRIMNRGAESTAPAYQLVTPTPPPTPPSEDTDGITVAYDGISHVTLSIPGCTVTHDGNGTVTLSGITVLVTDDGNGNITIGG